MTDYNNTKIQKYNNTIILNYKNIVLIFNNIKNKYKKSSQNVWKLEKYIITLLCQVKGTKTKPLKGNEKKVAKKVGKNLEVSKNLFNFAMSS